MFLFAYVASRVDLTSLLELEDSLDLLDRRGRRSRGGGSFTAWPLLIGGGCCLVVVIAIVIAVVLIMKNKKKS